jgi:hypothetical protein
VRGFVFDAGAFVALERRAPLLLGILDEALHGTVQIVLPRTVIAQVWRSGPRQANAGRLISAGRGRDGPVIIDELTAERAKQIGVTIGPSARDLDQPMAGVAMSGPGGSPPPGPLPIRVTSAATCRGQSGSRCRTLTRPLANASHPISVARPLGAGCRGGWPRGRPRPRCRCSTRWRRWRGQRIGGDLSPSAVPDPTVCPTGPGHQPTYCCTTSRSYNNRSATNARRSR